MTSVSLAKIAVNVHFFRDAEALYGENGLAPASDEAAGADLRACLSNAEAILIPPGERRAIPSGIAVEPQSPGIAGFLYSRSGLGAVKGVTVAQGVGLVDPDYRGEIMIFLLNTGPDPYTVNHGDRVAQLVFQPFFRPVFNKAEALGVTERGAGGFGHTGRR